MANIEFPKISATTTSNLVSASRFMSLHPSVSPGFSNPRNYKAMAVPRVPIYGEPHKNTHMSHLARREVAFGTDFLVGSFPDGARNGRCTGLLKYRVRS